MLKKSFLRNKIINTISVMIFMAALSFSMSGCSEGADDKTVAVAGGINESPEATSTPIPSVEEIVPSPTPTPEELVAYNGRIEHIFFHPLIVYPQRAFDNDAMSQGYNDWFVTVDEFKKIIDSLYSKNYILVGINDIYETKEEQGKKLVVKKDLKLPKGKKPLIISIDDLNYYEYMIMNGNASKLVLDSNGDVATLSIDTDDKEVISRDNDIVPILDKFVEEHKDFSFNGAKGIIALTGYEGVLGYRTHNLESPEFEKEKNEALQVIKRLKETGWTFASHGYGHLDAVKVSYERIAKDNDRWKKEVESLIGPTQVYIYPYGSAIYRKDKKLSNFLDHGFSIFFGVGADGYLEYHREYVIIDRRNIDGVSFKYQKEKLKDLFEVDDVIDSCRPKM